MRKLTSDDWTILRAYALVNDSEATFKALQLRANLDEMKELLLSTEFLARPSNSFYLILQKFPHSMSYHEQEELYRFLLPIDWHDVHDTIIESFMQRYCESPKNIDVILERMENVPPRYKNDDTTRYPFLSRCMWAIASQPEPYNVETLTGLSKSADTQISSDALEILEILENSKTSPLIA
jgi:hypothetical protein